MWVQIEVPGYCTFLVDLVPGIRMALRHEYNGRDTV